MLRPVLWRVPVAGPIHPNSAGLARGTAYSILAISRLPNSLLFSILGIFVRIAESNHLHAVVTGSDAETENFELMKSGEGNG
jgi:hypothetical protein